jgi:hypothetical protein
MNVYNRAGFGRLGSVTGPSVQADQATCQDVIESTKATKIVTNLFSYQTVIRRSSDGPDMNNFTSSVCDGAYRCMSIQDAELHHRLSEIINIDSCL